jgi:peptidoglycan/LPS O-acetylase OafA/YrhL
MQAGHMKQLPALTGLRAVAAYTVLFVHAIAMKGGGGWDHLYKAIACFGYFSMSLFFVLSGFVIHYNYARSFSEDRTSIAAKRFLVARFARLYPLYFVGLVLSLCFISKSHLPSIGVTLACLTLTQTWFNMHGAVGDIIGGSWSISTEVFLYLLFIPLAAVLARVVNPLRWIAYLSGAAIMLLATVYWFKDELNLLLSPIVITNTKISSTPFEWIVYFSPLIRAFEFFMGTLAAQFIMSHDRRRPESGTSSRIIAGCVLWMLFVGLVVGPHYRIGVIDALLRTFLWTPAIVISIILICRDDTPWSRFLSRPFMVAAGDISYSVYLLQAFVFVALSRSFPEYHGAFPILARAIFAVPITTALSYGTFHLLESPARDWIRRRVS